MKPLLIACILATCAGGAFAQDRFSLAETEDGTVRIDRQTGEVSFCRKVGEGLACTVAADERETLLTAIDELTTRISELEEQLAKAEAGNSETKTPALTGDEEKQLDKALRMSESVMRRFMEMMRDLKKDFDAN